MEEHVASVHGIPARGERGDGAIIVEVRHVEQIFGRQPLGPPERDVGAHIVQIAKAGSEGDVAGVIQSGAAEDEDAVLHG